MRTPSTIDQLMEDFLDRRLALDPILATNLGIPGHETRLPDLSPDGLAEVSELRRQTLARLAALTPVDAIDEVTRAAAQQQLGVAEQLRETGADESHLDNLSSPVQSVRAVFDLMATSTDDDWATVAARLAQVPQALDGYMSSLRLAASRGQVSARRQVEAGITQSHEAAEFFGRFDRAEVARGAAQAAEAYRRLARMLADELAPQAPERDAVGRERYALASQSFLGATIDLEETYEWGKQELAYVAGQQRATAERIKPGATVAEAVQHLLADPSRILVGTDALIAWMQDKSDAAVEALGATHFDIPEPIRTLECCIAPTPTGGIYYTGPSDDFSRPGRMWWSVPAGVNEFATWRELTTVYHEGVPGHHLQVGQTVYRREELNRWRRTASWVSGHGEGWALYAERLMGELGFLDDPADYLGMLDSQSFRAVRVVIDIGFHCGFPAPAEVGGGEWTYDKAWQLLRAHTLKTDQRLRWELDRYLGWPGQAASYKLGERAWLQLREEARARDGKAFDLKAFHRRALDIGGVGLDVLREVLRSPAAAQ